MTIKQKLNLQKELAARNAAREDEHAQKTAK